MMTTTTNLIHWEIFKAIFNPACTGLKIGNVFYPIKKSETNSCRYMWYDGILWMEQNPDKLDKDGKLTEGAAQARAGQRILWGRRDGTYIYKLSK